MAARNHKKLESDLVLITQIDDAEVDLPEKLCDLVEGYLRKLTSGEPLSEQERVKALALLEYVRRRESDCDHHA